MRLMQLERSLNVKESKKIAMRFLFHLKVVKEMRNNKKTNMASMIKMMKTKEKFLRIDQTTLHQLPLNRKLLSQIIQTKEETRLDPFVKSMFSKTN